LPNLAVLLIGAVVASGCASEDAHTRYATGFKEDVFLSLPMGVSQDEVIQKLGAPLEKWDHWNDKGVHDRTFWAYSKRESLGSTHYRVLIFSPAARLVEREVDYYLD
jgi:hypothetical protein